MVNLAVIFVDRFTRHDALHGWNPQKPLLGLTLLKRVILSANKAGLETFLIFFNKVDREVLIPLKRDRELKNKNIQINLFPLNHLGETRSVEIPADQHFLLLSDVLSFDPVILNKIKNLNLEPEQSLLYVDSKIEDQEDRLKIKVEPKTGTVAAAGGHLRAYDACYAGISVCSPRVFSELSGLFDKNHRAGIRPFVFSEIFIPRKTRVIDIGDHFSLEVTSAGRFKSTEKKLLNAVRKDSDGFVSRNFNRYISLFISKQLLKLHVSPNQISFANLLIGLASGLFILLGGYVNFLIGAVLFQLTSIIDGSDGEVAKLTFKCSKSGAWIDTCCDILTYLVFVLSLPIGLYRFYNDRIYLLLGATLLLSFIILYFMLMDYVKRAKASGSMLTVIADMHSHADGSNPVRGVDAFASKLTFIYRRDFFAFAFLVFCVFGGAWLYMWGLCLLAPLSFIYLYIFQGGLSGGKSKGPRRMMGETPSGKKTNEKDKI